MMTLVRTLLRHTEFLADPRRDLATLLVQRSDATAYNRDKLGGCRFRRAGIERRRGVIFDLQLDLPRDLLAFKRRRNRQSKINPRRNSGPSDDIAVNDDLLAHRDRAQRLEMLDRRPMAGSALALEQARCAQNERSGADRRHVF